MIAIALLLQAAGPQAILPSPRCQAEPGSDEVVVCARRGDSPHRLKPLPPRPGEPARDPLALGLPGGGEARLHAVQSNLPTASGQGLAVSLRIPIGKPKPRETR